jgi:predicted nucleotidyltransferase component of viral defense system
MKPNWKLIKSEYPETNQQFLVKVMDEREILAEKIIALNTRKKGRDLYDAWFLIEIGIEINKELLKKKSLLKKFNNIVSKKEYEQDLKYLTRRLIPYEQLKQKIDESLGN